MELDASTILQIVMGIFFVILIIGVIYGIIKF